MNATAVTAMAAAAHHPRLLRLPRRAVRGASTRRPAARSWPSEVAEVVEPAWVGARRRQLGPRPRHVVGARPHVPRRRRPGGAAVDQRRSKPLDYHLDLGAPPGAAARARACSIVASGNVVHNLRRIDWDDADRRASTGPSGSTTTPRDGADDRARATSLDSRDHHDFELAVPDARPLHPAPVPRRPRRRGRTTGRRARRRLRLRIAVDDLRTRSGQPPAPRSRRWAQRLRARRARTRRMLMYSQMSVTINP